MQASEVKQDAQEAAGCAASSRPPRARAWLIGGALLAVSLALYAGWGWLTAAGIAGVLISLAPCLVMCAIGLCASRASGKPK